MPKNQDEISKAKQELENAFSVFNQLSDHLSSSYQALEERISALNEELAAARSERLRQLAEKERLANRLSQLLAALPAGVVVLDGSGVVQECNRAAVDLLDEPLKGELWRDIINRAFDPTADAGQDTALRDGRLVSISTCPLGNEPGQIILLMDVTENRTLQNALERHKRLSAMGEVAAKLAHQVRTPLASALLYGSHLTRPNIQEQERQRFAEKLLDRLRHLEQVVEDMLSFARGGVVGKQRIAIEDLLRDLHQAMEPQLNQADCVCEMADEAPGAIVDGNRDALMGALQNLLNNGMQACGRGGRLRVLARPVKVHRGLPAVDLYVSDNGPGIPADVKDHVFEPFFTTRAQGTGLGLAVVQAIVQAHDGTVWVESTPEQGTTFVIRLPLAGSDEASGAQNDLNRSAV